MKILTKCTECSAVIHIYNQRFCCGIDYNPYLQELEAKEKDSLETTDNSLIVEVESIAIETPKKKKSWPKKTPKAIREKVLRRDKHKCTVCGEIENLHVHHIKYRSQGGTNDPSNLVTLCEMCHAEAHKDDPVYNIMKH